MAEPLIDKTDRMDYGTHKHATAQSDPVKERVTSYPTRSETDDEELAKQLHAQLNGIATNINGSTATQSHGSSNSQHHQQISKDTCGGGA